MQFINAVIVIKTIAKCSANLQKCSVHGRKSFMLLEIKRKKKKSKNSCQEYSYEAAGCSIYTRQSSTHTRNKLFRQSNHSFLISEVPEPHRFKRQNIHKENNFEDTSSLCKIIILVTARRVL